MIPDRDISRSEEQSIDWLNVAQHELQVVSGVTDWLVLNRVMQCVHVFDKDFGAFWQRRRYRYDLDDVGPQFAPASHNALRGKEDETDQHDAKDCLRERTVTVELIEPRDVESSEQRKTDAPTHDHCCGCGHDLLLGRDLLAG